MGAAIGDMVKVDHALIDKVASWGGEAMKQFHRWLAAARGEAHRRIRALVRGDGGAISPLIVLALVPLIGAFGVGLETSNWYLQQRAMQNASDTAAIAAASTGSTTCAAVGDYCYEAKAAAARFSFKDGLNNVTVTPSYFAAGACPVGAGACYKVAISKKLQLGMLQLVGYQGNVSGARFQLVGASAIASAGKPVDYCLLALGADAGPGSPALKLAGTPAASFGGCDVVSNGSAKCSGQNPGINFGDAANASTCGATPRVTGTQTADPDKALYTSGAGGYIPPPTTALCPSGYSQNTGGAITGSNLITSSTFNSVTATTGVAAAVAAGARIVCGNARLGNDITITTPNAVLIVYNGSLDMGGHTLSTTSASGGSLTVIFSGLHEPTSGPTYSQYPVDTVAHGVLDISAPNSGPFSGAALIQDYNLDPVAGPHNNMGMTYSGNSAIKNPVFALQGLVYMPWSNFQLNGAIDLHTAGLSCFALIAYSITVNGTGAVFQNDPLDVTAQCAAAGLPLPTVAGTTSRVGLVLLQ